MPDQTALIADLQREKAALRQRLTEALILIVDDNLLLQRAVVRVLSQAGYRTCTAADGQAALSVARSEKPDLILLDVMLPDISGIEVCRQLKADPALPGCLVVLLSSVRINSASQIEGLDGGADGYIAHPIPNAELLARVRGLLRIKQAEDRLRESAERYRFLVSNTSDYISRFDQAGQLIFVPDGARRFHGYEPAEILNTNGFERIHPEDRAAVAAALKALIQTGIPSRIEYRLKRKDGAFMWVESAGNRDYNPTGDPEVIVVQRDISARKQAETILRDLNATLEQRVADRTAELQAANARLTELDHLKDDFLSRISHELRTPLSGILISLELLETSKPERRERYIQRLKEAAFRLRDLIEDVLLFSQLSQAMDTAHLDRIDVNDWIEGRLTTWKTKCAERQLAFQLDLMPDLPRAVANPELMEQVLTRVLTNAVNYTPTGTVTLSTALRDEADRRWVTIGVTDTGPGIAAMELPHIFERFYRGHAAANYKTAGAGVGLTISREIAEKLGGRLTVETQVGAGSTFTVWLPLVV